MDNSIIQFTTDFYLKCLSANECAQSVLYLENRGITQELAREWSVGASLPSPFLLPKALVKKNMSLQEANTLNIITEDAEGRLKDRMYGRIPITIFSDYGEPISICGRAISEDVFPKYLFLPHTEDFNKDTTLYGLHKAYRSIFKAGFAVLTEGFFDVILAHSVGLRNTVATCGVHLSETQINKLKRWTRRVVIFYDGDRAGREKAQKNAELLSSKGLRAAIVNPPDGEDLDSCVRKFGRDYIRSVVSQATTNL